MSSNETTANNEQVTIEEVEEFPIPQVPYNNHNEPQVGFGVGANSQTTTPLSFGGTTGVTTTSNGGLGAPLFSSQNVPFTAPPPYGVRPFGGPPSTGTTSGFGMAFGGIRPATTGTVASGPLFGFRPDTVPAPNRNPSTGTAPGSQTGMGFSNCCGGPPRPVERHPETGQPIINNGTHNAPHNASHSACGGIQPPVSQVFGLPLGGNDKKKNIDTIYAKLAQARAKIAELNKFLDDIYETLPKIQ